MAMVTGAGNKLSLEHDVGREAAGLDRPSIARLDRIVEIPAGYLRGAGSIGRLAEGNITARRAWIGPRCRFSRRIGKLHITNLPGRKTRRRRRVAHGNDNGICDYEALLDHRAVTVFATFTRIIAAAHVHDHVGTAMAGNILHGEIGRDLLNACALPQ